MSLDSIIQAGQGVQAERYENGIILFDTHFSDKRSDRHNDYWANCMEVCENVVKIIEDEKLDWVVLPGDLVGRMKDKNLVTREGFLYIAMWLQKLNQLTNGKAYIDEGNHDQSEHITDYQTFVALGLIKNVKYFDTGITRVHLINYGEEHREIELREGANNVAVMHNEFVVEGATTWFFNSKKAITLASLTNLKGITRIYSGHIHTPSPKPVEYNIDGVQGVLHYMGCPTKPSFNRNDYEFVYPVIISSSDKSVKERTIKFECPKDVWKTSINLNTEEDAPDIEDKDFYDEKEVLDVAKLTEIMSTISEYNLLGSTNYEEQLKALGVVDKESVDMILGYIEKAERLYEQKIV